VEKAMAEDSNLSWAARGILLYLLAKPDDWKVFVSDLQKRGDLGRDAIYTRINELMRHGYMQRTQVRNSAGQIVSSEYLVFERPYTENPYVGNPDADFPDAVKPTQLNNNRTNKTNNKKTITKQNVVVDHLGLNFPIEFSVDERVGATSQLQDISKDMAQIIIDEVAARSKKSIIENKIGYVRSLVNKHKAGEFSPELAHKVAERRVSKNHLQEILLQNEKAHKERLAKYAAAKAQKDESND